MLENCLLAMSQKKDLPWGAADMLEKLEREILILIDP
jgi:hypothetical protein